MKHRRKDDPQDQLYDDLVIADMNIEGMPWYQKKEAWHAAGKQDHQYTKKETLYIILGTLKASLMIALAYIGGLLLIILLLCVVSWLRHG